MKYLSDVNETGVFSFIRAVPKSIYYFVIAHFEGILRSDHVTSHAFLTWMFFYAIMEDN